MINQTNYGLSQTGQQAQLSQEQLAGQIGQAQAQGAQYQAGALGVAGLFGGVNYNAALSGGG